MRRAQLLSVVMLLALGAVVVTVLVTTAREPMEEARAPRVVEGSGDQFRQAEPEQGGDGSGSANGEAEAPSEPAEESETPSGPFIERVALNGQDLAELLDLTMWKFEFRIPENEYTLYLWVERWTRNAAKPEVREITTLSGVWSEDEIIVKLPTEADRRLFFSIGEAVSRSEELEPIQLPDSPRREILQRATIQPGRDVYLVTYTHNELETATGGRVNVHRQNDETVYIKMRLTPGPFVPFDAERILSNSY